MIINVLCIESDLYNYLLAIISQMFCAHLMVVK